MTTETELEVLDEMSDNAFRRLALSDPVLRLPAIRALFDARAEADPEPAAEPPAVGPAADGTSSERAEPSGGSTRIKASRGVDSLFRNAYRAQLDMLALAATKANIMISLNGLLMSLLIISGTHFVDADDRYAIPITLLLVTCAVATVFAVLAARPSMALRHFRREDFESDRARLLVFDEFADLDEDEYIGAMGNMLGDRQRVYENMLAHVHRLGAMADRTYRQLYYSYTAFMVGIVMTVATLLVLEGMKWWQGPSPL